VKVSEEKYVMLGDGEDGHKIVGFFRKDGQIVDDEGEPLPVRFSPFMPDVWNQIDPMLSREASPEMESEVDRSSEERVVEGDNEDLAPALEEVEDDEAEEEGSEEELSGRCGDRSDVNDGHQDDDDSDEDGIPRNNCVSGTAQPMSPARANAQNSAGPSRGGQSGRYYLRSTRPGGLQALIANQAMAVKAAVADIRVPEKYTEAVGTPQAENWLEAMQEGMNSLASKQTWTYVPRPLNCKVIPVRWVYAVKQDVLGQLQRFKARVVAKGFMQIEGIDFFETYAPVCNQVTRRMVYSLAASESMHMHHLDVKTAFLNGVYDETVYVEQPPGFVSGLKDVVCKLNKALYGLKQAPRAWHQALVKVLTACGFVASKADPGLFIKSTASGKLVYLTTYVDDMLLSSKSLTAVEDVKAYLGKEFKIHDLGEATHFLGNMITRDWEKGTIRVSNPVKIKELLEEFKMSDCRPVLTPMDKSFVIASKAAVEGVKGGSGTLLGEGHRYPELVGSLLYLANTTRPDITLAVGILSRYRAAPTTAHWAAGMRVLAYLKGTLDLGLEYSKKQSSDLLGYVDSDYAACLDTRKSTLGYVFMLNGAAVSWSSKKQKSVASSTVEAEYMAFHQATKEALWLSLLLREMLKVDMPVTLYCDNAGCLANLRNHMSSVYTKHIDVAYHSVRVRVSWVKLIRCMLPAMTTSQMCSLNH
jgi:hypothetical protein